jgi:hypothetical protein
MRFVGEKHSTLVEAKIDFMVFLGVYIITEDIVLRLPPYGALAKPSASGNLCECEINGFKSASF